MANSGDKTGLGQNACEFTDYVSLVKLEKARKITLFLNGDKNFFGAQMIVNKRHFRTWDAFLNASTEKTGVNHAVRFITTPVNGTRLDGLDDLQDKEAYVAMTRGPFKPIGYTTLYDRHMQYLAGNVHRTSSILKIRPVEHSRIQVPGKIAQIPIHALMINVFLNGKDFDAPFRIALSQKVLRRWGLVMREIADHVSGILGRPKALYTVDGSRVITNPLDLEPGGMYVIVGSEPGGFQHYCYGCQTSRVKNPRKLPPIKRKRRKSKRILETEMSSFDAQPPAEAEALSGNQESQQSIKELTPVVTSQGDFPQQGDFPPFTTFPQLDDTPLDDAKSPPSKQESCIIPKSEPSVERTASLQMKKASSEIQDAERRTSAPFYTSGAQLNYDGSAQINGTGLVEDSQFNENVTNTDTEEETEQEMEGETEQEEEEAERTVEVEKEKENDALFEREIASSKVADLVPDMQRNSETDEVNRVDNKNSERSAAHEFHAEDFSTANSEEAGPSLETRDVGSDGQLDQGDNKAEDKTDIDVEEETKHRNVRDSAAVALDKRDSDAPIAKRSDETLTENKVEPAPDGDTNENLIDDKTQSENIGAFLLDDDPRSEKNTDVEEKMEDHSEQDTTLAPIDTNDSDAAEQAKRISSDTSVQTVFNKVSNSLSAPAVPLEKDPTTQKSSSKTDIQPHR